MKVNKFIILLEYLNIAFSKEKSNINLNHRDRLDEMYFKAIEDENEFKKWSLYICHKYLNRFYKSKII